MSDLLDLNAHLNNDEIQIRQDGFNDPVLFLFETIDGYKIRIPITHNPTAIKQICTREDAIKMFPNTLVKLEEARQQTHIYSQVVKRTSKIVDCEEHLTKFIALHGVLPLHEKSKNEIEEMWTTFAKQHTFSWAALEIMICKDDTDFNWKYNWKSHKTKRINVPNRPKIKEHYLDVLNDWLIPMGLSFRNGSLCLILKAFKKDIFKSAYVYLTNDPLKALEFLGYDAINAQSIIKNHASNPAVLCTSRYFSPSVLKHRAGFKFSVIGTSLQKYALKTYPDIYEKQNASHDQLKELTNYMQTRAFQSFPEAPQTYKNTLDEIKMFDKIYALNDQINDFKKQITEKLPFGVRSVLIDRLRDFIYLNGLMPLDKLDSDQLYDKWNTFRSQIFQDGLAPHDWIAARNR